MTVMPKMDSNGRRRVRPDGRLDRIDAIDVDGRANLRSSARRGPVRPLGGALGSAPFFSPDGKWLGFWHTPTGTLRKVALSGGAPTKIADAVSGIAGATWGPDDTIVFAWFDLFRVPASGGSPTPPEGRRATWRAFLPASIVPSIWEGGSFYGRDGGHLLRRC